MRTFLTLLSFLLQGVFALQAQWALEQDDYATNVAFGLSRHTNGDFVVVGNVQTEYGWTVNFSTWRIEADGSHDSFHVEPNGTYGAKHILRSNTQGWNGEVYAVTDEHHILPVGCCRHGGMVAWQIDANGEPQRISSTNFSDPNYLNIQTVCDLNDGVAIVGFDNSDNADNLGKPWIRALNAGGGVAWELHVPQATDDRFVKACRHPNDGLVAMTGESRKLIHISDAGEVLDETSLDAIYDGITVIKLESDVTGIRGVGSVVQEPGEASVGVYFELSPELEPSVLEVLPEELAPHPMDFTTTQDGGFVFVNSVLRESTEMAVVLKMDAAFDLEWESTYTGAYTTMLGEDMLPSISVSGVAEGVDGAVAVSGLAHYPDGPRMLVFSLSSTGETPKFAPFYTVTSPFEGGCGEIVRITNLLGQEVVPERGRVLLYHFADGCIRKVVIE